MFGALCSSRCIPRQPTVKPFAKSFTKQRPRKKTIPPSPAFSFAQTKGLIFDLDGTLVDSFADIAAALNATRQRVGLEPLPLAQVKAAVGHGPSRLVQELVPSTRAHQQILGWFMQTYSAHCLVHTTLIPHAKALLAACKPRRLAVVSNKPITLVETMLDGLGIRPFFNPVLGGDSLASQKPHPAPLQHVQTCWGMAASQLVMVGDDQPDVRAANAAGMACVLIHPNNAQTPLPSTLAATKPTLIVPDLGALLALV